MKSAGNGGVQSVNLQMIMFMYFLFPHWVPATWCQTGTDQHEGGVAVRRGTHHTDTAAELPAEPLNDIVGPDVDPVLKEKIAVGKGFLNSILHLFGSQLHCPHLRDHGFCFLMGGFLAFLCMDCLEHFGHQLHLGTWGKKTHCGKSGRYTADTCARGTLLLWLPCQGTCCSR